MTNVGLSPQKGPNQSAAANRRPAGQSDGSDNLAPTLAADRAFPAAVAELVVSAAITPPLLCAYNSAFSQ